VTSAEPDGAESPAPTDPTSAVPLDPDGLWSNIERRLFATNAFFRLWAAQFTTGLGDWLGFLAITVTAARVGGGSPETAVGIVMAARLIPGFFFAQLAGVLADRWDKRRLMVVCDISRAAVLLVLPFVDTVWQLVLVSLALEAFTLLWIPAKESMVPSIVPREHLTTANSLSMVATYGTFPIAALIFVGLARGADAIADVDAVDFLRIDQESLGFYVDALTFGLSAVLVASIPFRHSGRVGDGERRRLDFVGTFREMGEGVRFIVINPTVRAVNIGLATALLGGGMMVPLGIVYSEEVLGAGPAGFAGMQVALGVGLGLGVLLLTLLKKHVSKRRLFAGSVVGAGAALLVAASLGTLALVIIAIGVVGMFAGGVYVLGFTLLHEEVDEDLRGRVFAALYSVVRLCVVAAFVIGPLLAAGLDGASHRLVDRGVDVLGLDVYLPGVRLTLWLAGLIIMGAGVGAAWSLRSRRPASLKAVW
jgi:dTMP kinase